MSHSAVNSDSGPIYQRINEIYGDLPAQAQRVADLVLDRLGDIGTYSIAELAELSGASSATVSRLFLTLGYTGFAEVKSHVRALRNEGIPITAAPQRDSPHLEAMQHEVENLQKMFSTLTPERLDEVARAVAGARQVLVGGYHSSFPLAMHLRSQLNQTRPNVRLVPQPGQSMGQELTDIGEGDVAIIFGFRRRLSQFHDLMRFLATTGAFTILIADPTARRHAATADIWLVCPVDSTGAFDSLASAMGLCSVVADAVLQRCGSAGQRQVLRMAAVHETLSELDGEDRGYRSRN